MFICFSLVSDAREGGAPSAYQHRRETDPCVPGSAPVKANFDIILISFPRFASYLAQRFTRSSMRYPCKQLLVSLSAIFLTLPASAQDRPAIGDPPTPNAATQPLNLPKVLTGKERLGKKWMDEQRIDNCKVPIDKRGTKPRPSICKHVSMGTLRPGTENLYV